jgi:DNA-binding GntR family transcriptional regulator
MKANTAPQPMEDESDLDLERTVLHDRVVDHLRAMIISGELEPGERIPERDLCQRLNVSRTPLREALKVLAAEEMIQLLPYRGAVVTKLTAAETADILLIISSLEQLAAGYACANATKADIADIERTHNEMVALYKQGDLTGYFQMNMAIHEKIVEASGNKTLLKIYRVLNNRVVRQRFMSNLKQSRWEISIKEHVEILRALKKRDATRLADTLAEHYRSSLPPLSPASVRRATR